MNTALPSLERLSDWLTADEGERLEFKEAKRQFDSDKLSKYCVALANEGGGHLVFGVTDKLPRRVVGTQAFQDLSALKRTQSQRLRLRIDATALEHPSGRVVVVSVPSRPIGTPIQYKGAYWMRRGEDLVAMSPEVLKSIFDEAQPDYSAEICAAATMADLEPTAIETLRELWRARSGNEAITHLSTAQLLEDAELTVDGALTYAALILLGTRKGLGRHLAQAETLFEYRSTEESVQYQQREEFREGFLLYLDRLWTLIGLRNDIYQYQDGLFRRSIPTFNERVIREALMNALAHRDYRMGGSIFVRQSPKRLEIVSPGGFPPGITAENILWKQAPRNRRVAEVMAKCGLVERSGQGVDLMVGTSIQESKPLPDYTGTDPYEVHLVLNGAVQDEEFLQFLARVGSETLASFSSGDFVLLDVAHRDLAIPERLRPRLTRLVELGVLERKGRGRGTRYLLSERFYKLSNARGSYTRRVGLDKDTNMALLLKHIERNREEGSPFRDLQQVLPALSRPQIQRLLGEMKTANQVHMRGRTRGTRWYPGPQTARAQQ